MNRSAMLHRAQVLVLGLVVLVAGALLAAPARAHDVLIASDPEEGQVLTEAPSEVVLTFNNEPLELGSAIVVADADGEPVVEGEGTVEGTDVRLELDSPLAGGEYEVQWRVASSDGHPIDGTIPFTVDAPAEQSPEPTTAPEVDAEPAAVPAAPAGTNDAPEAAPDEAAGASGLGALPMWLRVAVGLAALASVVGLIVLTTRRLRGDR